MGYFFIHCQYKESYLSNRLLGFAVCMHRPLFPYLENPVLNSEAFVKVNFLMKEGGVKYPDQKV